MIISREQVNEFIALADRAIEIFESDADWQLKYDLIFSKTISSAIKQLWPIDYYDPDTSYQEDVTSFIAAVEEQKDRLSKLLDIVSFQ